MQPIWCSPRRSGIWYCHFPHFMPYEQGPWVCPRVVDIFWEARSGAKALPDIKGTHVFNMRMPALTDNSDVFLSSRCVYRESYAQLCQFELFLKVWCMGSVRSEASESIFIVLLIWKCIIHFSSLWKSTHAAMIFLFHCQLSLKELDYLIVLRSGRCLTTPN